MSLPDKKTGFLRVVAATRYSLSGFVLAARTEEAFKQECLLFVLLAPVGVWLGETDVEKVLLVGALVVVLIIELLNTAVEAVVDRVGAEFHELSRQAKDLGSAAVFLSLGYVVFTWLVILFF